MLDHDVYAFFVGNLSDFFRNFLFVVIDAVIGAERPRLFQFLLIAGGRDHAAMKHFRDLNRSDANARTCAQNKHSLSGTGARQSHEHVPRSHEHKRNASRLLEIK